MLFALPDHDALYEALLARGKRGALSVWHNEASGYFSVCLGIDAG
jgi:hypothetical protein